MTTLDPTRHTVETPFGRLSYHVAGSGPALFLLHGSGPGVSGMENFAANLEWFATRFRTYVPDLPGYGESDPAPGPGDNAPGALLAMMDALGIAQTALIGNSYGGGVATRFAADYPDRTRRVMAIGGIGHGLFAPFPNEGINLLTEFVEDPTPARMRQWLHSMVFDKAVVTEAMVERRMARALEPNTRATTHAKYCRSALAQITRSATGFAGIERLGYLARIQCPTLLAWGRDDRVSQLDRAFLPMQIIPRCELHIFPQCGHWVMVEAKQAFEAMAMAFLTQDTLET